MYKTLSSYLSRSRSNKQKTLYSSSQPFWNLYAEICQREVHVSTLVMQDRKLVLTCALDLIHALYGERPYMPELVLCTEQVMASGF